MTIEIVEEFTVNDISTGFTLNRAVRIAIDNGGSVYDYIVGGLPLAGDLQTILDARESELFAKAEAKGEVFEAYNATERRVIKALALVIMDEFNILRAIHGLADRTPAQIETAVKNKLKAL